MCGHSRSFGLLGLLAITGGLAGCNGGQLIRERNAKIKALEADLAQRESELSEACEVARTLEKGARTLQSEKTDLEKQVGEARGELRRSREQFDRLTAEKVRLTSRAVEWERSYERLKKRLDNVQSVGSKTADEFAELKLKAADLAEKARRLEKANLEVRQENSRLGDRLETTLAQLKAAQAVARTLARETKETGLSTDMERQVVDLKKANQEILAQHRELLAELQLFKNRLPRKVVEELERTRAETPDTDRADQGTAALYYDDPAGLWHELVAYVSGRYQAMVNGEATWSAADVGLAGASIFIAAALLWLAFWPVRHGHRRRLRAELARLKARIESAEDARVESDTAGTRARGRSAVRSGSFVRRSGQFSPIFSGLGGGEGAEAATTGSMEDGDRRPGGGGPASVPGPSFQLPEDVFRESEPASAGAAERHVIGAHQWAEAASDEEEDAGNTQIIPAIGDLEYALPTLQPGSMREASAASPSPGGRSLDAGAESDDDDDDDDESGNTQIIPSLDAIETLGTEDGAPRDREGTEGKREARACSADLLSELEDIIGQKVDEIL